MFSSTPHFPHQHIELLCSLRLHSLASLLLMAPSYTYVGILLTYFRYIIHTMLYNLSLKLCIGTTKNINYNDI